MKVKISVVFLIMFFIITINLTPIYAADNENEVNQVDENSALEEKLSTSEKIEKQDEKNKLNGTSNVITKEETVNKKIVKSTGITLNYTHTGNLKSKQYIRKKADVNSKKSIVIKKGKKVTILGEKSNFYKIKYKKGKRTYKGYIKKKFIPLNEDFSMKVGKTKKISPKILPKKSTDRIRFKTSDKKIATVNSYGEITAKRKGIVKITAITDSGMKDYVTVRVKKSMYSKPKEYMELNKIANDISKKYKNVKKIIYGKSILGEKLEAYEIIGNGNNSKVMFIETGLHGYEDEYPKDAKVLVKLANKLIKYYAKDPKILKDYKLVIIPCANPDGTLYGKNNYRANKKNAFGRCTYKGIDMNRDFDDSKFKAKESRALKKLINKYGERIKINLDIHGWEDSVLGHKKIVKIFRKYVGNKKDKSGQYGGNQGFIIDYFRKRIKARSALIEFKNSKSIELENVEKAINEIVSIY